MPKRKVVRSLILWCILSLGLYALFFANAGAVVDFFKRGGVGPAAVLVVTAIIFSQIHGNFAGAIYEFFGIRPKGH
ncbi:MAG: hypothetical protein ACUVRC_05750 [Desulfotomaculales bacterium]